MNIFYSVLIFTANNDVVFPKILILESGEEASISCLSATPPRWLKDGKALLPHVRHIFLGIHIPNVNTIDAGHYHCNGTSTITGEYIFGTSEILIAGKT